MSLRNKLTLVIIALLTLGLVVAGIGTTLLLRPTLVEQMDAELRSAAAEPATVIGGNPTTHRFSYDNVRAAPRPYYVALTNTGGQVLVDNWGASARALVPDIAELAAESSERPAAGAAPVVTIHDGLGAQWRAVALPEGTYPGDQVRGTLVIALPMSSVNATMASFLAIFFGFGITVVIFGAALTRLLVSATLTPLRRVEETAMSVAAGDYDARLPGAPPNTEVGRLSRAFNAMLGRIDTALEDRDRTIERMRRFVGDASHELRTPLVTVRGYGELYRMGALDEPDKVALAMNRIESEAIRMTGLVEDLLQLARLDDEAKDQANKELLDLESIVQDAAIDAHASAPDRPIHVVPVRVIVSDEDLDRAAKPATKQGSGSHALTLEPAVVVVEGERMEIPEELQQTRAEREAREQQIEELLATTESIPIVSGARAGRASTYSGMAAIEVDDRGGEAVGDAAVGDARGGAAADAGAGDVATDAGGRRFLRWRPARRPDRAERSERAQGEPQPAARRGRRLLRRLRGGGDAQPVAALPEVDASLQAPGDGAEEILEIPAMILGNGNKVRQSIQNIIGNALRYTPEGSPLELGVVIDPGRRETTVEVIDHGEGVPKELRERIFERFYRADTSRARETGGSGLGLAIVAAIVRSHGGDVEVVETPGGGATFRLTFPLLLAEAVDS